MRHCRTFQASSYQIADPMVSSYDFPFRKKGSVYDYPVAAHEPGRTAGPELLSLPEALSVVHGHHVDTLPRAAGVSACRGRGGSSNTRRSFGDVFPMALPQRASFSGLRGCLA